jgi:hypothetical protein
MRVDGNYGRAPAYTPTARAFGRRSLKRPSLRSTLRRDVQIRPQGDPTDD